jgi:hypothetical protein
MNLPRPTLFAPPVPSARPATPERARWLTILLLVRAGVSLSALAGLMYAYVALSTPSAREAGLDTSELRTPILLALAAGLFDLVGVVGTLAWRRWGVYALVVSTGSGLLLRLNEGGGLVVAASALLLLPILSGVLTQWSSYE